MLPTKTGLSSRLTGCLLGAGCLVMTCLCAGQLSAAGPEFEVASVRPAPPITPELLQSGKLRQGITMDAGRVDFAGIQMTELIAYAFGVPQNRIAGPDWMQGQRIDIQAKLPAGATEDQVPAMLQTLLADRFKLTIHREHKDQSGYALVVAKGGAKVKTAAPDAEPPAPPPADPNAPPPPTTIAPMGGSQVRITEDPKSRGGTASNPLLGTVRFSEDSKGLRLEAPNTTFEGLAQLLTELMRQPVVDLTALKGRYQVVLDLVLSGGDDGRPTVGQDGPGAPGASTPDPRINAVIGALDKIGLKMDSRKMTVETIVVDHLEKNPTGN
jgi:uncharacterized protein (TIGR03435 family)